MQFGVQIATRFDDETVAAVDQLVAAGRFGSRADAVRSAVVHLLEEERRRAVGEAIVNGYRRVPQDDDDVALAEANLRRLIAEEPW